MSSTIIYEQPLNERMRTFMRLEQLYARCAYYLEKENPLDSHYALITLLELVGLTSRGDLKQELIKEVKRQLANLQQLVNITSLDQNKLDKLLNGHNQLINQLDSLPGQLLNYLKDHDFISSIKQRSAIPGGTCDFDLPAYRYWLTQTAAKRQTAIKAWLSPFDVINQTTVHCLNLIRDSAETENCLAHHGFFQRTLDQTQPHQLLRILIQKTHQCFPEISAGKHRFSIRFLQQTDPNQYPKQARQDIQFKLVCCAF